MKQLNWTTTSMRLSFNEEKGLLIIRPHEGFRQAETLEHARENIEISLELVGSYANIKGILAFMPDHYINVEITRYYKQNVPNVPIAMVGDSFFKKMIGNFLMILNSPDRPIRLFTNEEEALLWLENKINDDRE